MSSASSLTLSPRRRLRRNTLVIAAVLLFAAVGVGVGVGIRARSEHSHAVAPPAAPVYSSTGGVAPANARGGQADAIAAAATDSSFQPSSVAPADARGGQAESIASGAANSSAQPAGIAPVDARGGAAEVIARGQQARASDSSTTAGAPLLVYVVATPAAQDGLSRLIGYNDQFVTPAQSAPLDYVVVAIAPDDSASLQALPAQYANRAITVVDLRQ